MKFAKVKFDEVGMVENSRDNEFDNADLMASIKENGLIQPVVLAPNYLKGASGKSKYILVAGNRRFDACRKLGMASVDAVVNPRIKNEADLLIYNMSENLQRRDVSAFEQGRLIDRLMRKHKMTIAECAARLGVKPKVAKDMLVCFRDIPKKYSEKISNVKGASKSGHIPLALARKAVRARREGLSRLSVRQFLDKAASGHITCANSEEILEGIKSGRKIDDVMNNIKKISHVTVTIPVYTSERELIDGSTADYLKQIVYGETKDAFTRPRA